MKQKTYASPELIDIALQIHGNGDEVEIDEPAEVSEGEDGTWVQAWVFVPKHRLPGAES